MIRYLLLIAALLPIAPANAATGGDWWKNCPGPGCPAKEPEPAYEKSERARKDYEEMDRERLRREREAHERALEKIEKEERNRATDR